MKNIPIASKKEHQIQLLNSINGFVNRAKWVACHSLNESSGSNKKECFGFNSSKAPPMIEELFPLQDKLYSLVKNVKYREEVRNKFQDNLKKQIKVMKNDPKVYIASDKTGNHYKMEDNRFEAMLQSNITNDYKKAEVNKYDEIKEQAVKIVTKLEIADRVCKTELKNANITIKDHKENFINNPKCRLLNPTKTELGKISKQIQEG